MRRQDFIQDREAFKSDASLVRSLDSECITRMTLLLLLYYLGVPLWSPRVAFRKPFAPAQVCLDDGSLEGACKGIDTVPDQDGAARQSPQQDRVVSKLKMSF